MTCEPIRSIFGADGSDRAKPPREGVTLIEIMLVLALLVVIGAVAAPMLEGSLARAKLEQSGELVRAAWTKARLSASESGETRVFRFEQNGARYQILALGELLLPENSTLSVDDTPERDVSDLLRLGEARLPDGVVFAKGEVSASAQVAALLGETAVTGWSAPILFRPDGTTSDATLVLANSAQQTIVVTLRGLTGVSRVSDESSEVVR